MHTTALEAAINAFGPSKNDVASTLGDLVAPSRNPGVTITETHASVTVRVRSHFKTTPETQARLDETVAQVEQRLGPVVYSRSTGTLQESLVRLLHEKQHTAATAESCTGGWVGKMVTDVAGASSVYLGGWIVYSNQMKSGQLGVPEQMIHQHGAVSGPVACAMAAGVIERSGADLGIAITGIAGPEGGSTNKPVGTVWIALGKKDQPPSGSVVTEAWRSTMPGDRSAIRHRAAMLAMQILRFAAMGLPIKKIFDG